MTTISAAIYMLNFRSEGSQYDVILCMEWHYRGIIHTGRYSSPDIHFSLNNSFTAVTTRHYEVIMTSLKYYFTCVFVNVVVLIPKSYRTRTL